MDHVRNAVAKLRPQVLVPECPRDPHSLCRGVVAKGHKMGIHFTSRLSQLGVLVELGSSWMQTRMSSMDFGMVRSESF